MVRVGKNDTIRSLIKQSVAHFSNRVSMQMVDGTPLTYADVDKKIAELQQRFFDVGVKKGDRVAILAQNSPQWAVLYFAIVSYGAVAVPILPDFHENEVHHIIKQSRSMFLFCDEKGFEKVDAFDFSALHTIVDIATFADKKVLRHPFSTIEAGSSFSVDALEAEDIAVLLYTSGTSGHAKGVLLSHRNLSIQLEIARAITTILPDDRFLSILPLAHTFESSVGLIVPFFSGSQISYLGKAPTPTLLLDALEKVKPTFMLSVPLVIEKIYAKRILPKLQSSKVLRTAMRCTVIRKFIHKKAGAKLYALFGGQLRFFGIGGAKLREDVEQFLQEAGFPYAIGYGMSECAPLISGINAFKNKIGSAGIISPLIEAKIVKQRNEDAVGELYIRGENVMQGYIDSAHSDALFVQGWFNTQDIGYIDEENYLFLTGRSRNIIVGASGENIYPEAIESIIAKEQLVVESIVYEVEKKLVARIVLDYDQIDTLALQSEEQRAEFIALELKRIVSRTNEQLASYSKVHHAIEQREPFVKTPTMKIKRFLYN